MRLPSTLVLPCLLSLLAGQAFCAGPRREPRASTDPRAPAKRSVTAPAPAVRPPAPARHTAPAPPASPARPARPAAGDPLGAADAAYARKSFAVALRGYRDALGRKAVPERRRPQVEYRVARCLGKTKQWDAALAESLRLAARYPGTAWEARSRGWLMQLYLAVPHEAWKVGDRTFRGQDAPRTEDAAQPERVDLAAEDARKAVLAGEAAKALWEKLRAGGGSGVEEADLAADLARVIGGQVPQWAQALQWKAPGTDPWRLDPDVPYDSAWAPPKKVLQLLLAAERLGDDSRKPLARLAQALWLRGYHAMMRQTVVREEMGRAVRIPYPYQELPALDALRDLAKDYPQHPEGEHARVLIGDWLAQEGKYTEALEAHRAFIKERPASKWAEDARVAAAEITRLSLDLSSPAPQAPGKKALLQVEVRNLKKVRFTAHRIRLEEALKDPRLLPNPDAQPEALLARLGKLKGLRKFYQGDAVTWETAVADIRPASEASEPVDREQSRDPYAPVSGEVAAPLARNGAYVVEADGGPVRAAVVLLISDLAVVQMVDEARALAFVVNAATGAPVYEASALFREQYADPKGKRRVALATATTNADGQAERKAQSGRPNGSQFLTVAWKGDRYALTATGYHYPHTTQERPSAAYLYTERPVYRPAQTVYYRALLAGRTEEGDWKPLRDRKVRVTVHDPRGAEIAAQELTSGAFGSLHGRLELPSEAPLGEYQISLAGGKKDEPRVEGGGSFRVEEYKKPEFEVTVSAAPGAPELKGLHRAGDRLTAKIAARYYFGAPVPRAKVTYTVTRSEWVPESPFPMPYAFLYSSPDGGREMEEEEDGEWVPVPEGEVASGTALTDAQGEASITFPTELKDPRLKGRHLRFTIQAEVTDASRRTIQGSGEVRALASQFNAFLNVRQGFTNVGDRLQADVRTLDADGKPLSVQGTVRVLRLTTADGKLKRDEVGQEGLRTDEQGRGLFTWTPDRDGGYEVRFEARDAWEQLVVGRERAWVAGEGAGAGVFHNRHVLLVPEATTYRQGQTAKLLLVADEPGLSFLLTEEAGSRILDRRLVRMTGRSQTLEIPITRREAPDVVFAVTGVRDRELFRSQATLYVPPADQLLNVEVTADKPQYRPGERARFRLRARDVDGRGVRTECSVGVVDASVFYIQGETTPPIASFFYAGERGSSLDAQESLASSFEPLSEDDQPFLKGERREWQFPAGLGELGSSPASTSNVDGDKLVWADSSLGDERFAAISHRRGTRVESTIASGHLILSPEPAPRAAKTANAPSFMGLLGGAAGGEGAPGAPPVPPPAIRKAFADTAFWTPAVVTDASGEATVEVTWPDNLTQWRATARGWSETAQVGEATADVSTSKDLLVRLQAPRFFVERDEVVLSANVHNYTGEDRRVSVTLQVEGGTLAPFSTSDDGPQPVPVTVPRADRQSAVGSGQLAVAPAATDTHTPTHPHTYTLPQSLDLPKGAEGRVDWRVRVERAGEARIRVLAQAGAEGDAVEMTFPVLVHGVEKLLVKSGAMLMSAGDPPGERSVKLKLDLPAERDPESGALVVDVSPSVGAAMLDALPYLVDYPYGCVEQTLSRFVPSVLCAKTLADLGVDLAELKKRAEQEYRRLKDERPADRPEQSGYTYPAGYAGRAEAERMARELWGWRAEKSPVYDPALLKRMTTEGLARLRKFQHRDGGWGWWQHDDSDPRMTATVLQGLLAARAAGLEVPAAMLEGGLGFLERRFPKEANLHDLTSLGWTLVQDVKRAPAAGTSLLERVYPQRERLTAYSLALLALALKQSGHAAEARVCMENLENTARIDRESSTCSWTRNDGPSWYWYNDDVETAAVCLRVFNRLDPKHRLAPMVVRWLCNNRAGSSWSTTRETALAVEALAEYVKANRELEPDCTVTVQVGSGFKRSFTLTAADALLSDHRFSIPARGLTDGPQEVTITRQGRGSVYYSASLRYFTLEEGIQAAGNEIRARRRYYRLTKAVPQPGGAAAAGASADGYTRALLKPGEPLRSGDLLEVELLLESKNSYDYLVFEDMKPAGCEPVDLRSGTRYGDGLCSNMELRDEKVAFFITRLPQGRRMLTYRLRAEVPGVFHALPLNGYAMYAPNVRCISNEANLRINDESPAAP